MNKPRPTSIKGDNRRDNWRTPKALFAPLHARFNFKHDMAASAENALCPSYCTDALRIEAWKREGCCWCNPPFSRIPEFLRVAQQACWQYTTESVILVPANRCEQSWWVDYVIAPERGPCAYEVWLLQGRVPFDPPLGTTNISCDRPPFGCALIVYVHEPFERQFPVLRSYDWRKDELR